MSNEEMQTNFNDTARSSQADIRLKIKDENNKLILRECWQNSDYAIECMNKVVEKLPSDILETVKVDIDNVYYHLGRIKGASL